MSHPQERLSTDAIVDLLTSDHTLDDPIVEPATARPDTVATTSPERATDVSEASQFIKNVLANSEAGDTETDPAVATIAIPEPDDNDPFDRSLRSPQPDAPDADAPPTAEEDSSPDLSPGPVEPTRRRVIHTVVERWNTFALITKIGIAGGTALAVVVAATWVLGYGSESDASQAAPYIVTTHPGASNTTIPSGSRPPASPATVDRAIKPSSASSRCPAGSTDPMQAFDDAPNTAWVCVRVYGIDGQVLTVHLDHPYVITSMSIIPGWNKTNADGSDEWVKHRTVSTVKYTFDDTTRSSFEQQTQDVRDEVITPITTPVLASTIQITVLKTSALTGADPHTDGAGMSVGPATGNPSTTDFAVSSITVTGHAAN